MPRSSSAGTDIQPDWLKFLLTAKSHPAILAAESNSFPVYLFLSPSGREGWIKRFILFHDKCNPTEMGEKEIGQYLSFLATDSRVSASTQNQALNGILFLYHEVLGKDIGYVNGLIRAGKGNKDRYTMLPDAIIIVATKIYERFANFS